MIRLIKLIYLALLLPVIACAGETETDIQQQVSDYVLSQIQTEPSDKVDVIANAVDQRLNLSACQQPLVLNITGTGEISSRIFSTSKISISSPSISVTAVI